MPDVAELIPDRGAPGMVVEVELVGTGLDWVLGVRVSGRGVRGEVIGQMPGRRVRIAMAIAGDAAAGPRAVVAIGRGGEMSAAVLFHVLAAGSGGGAWGIGAQLI